MVCAPGDPASGATRSCSPAPTSTRARRAARCSPLSRTSWCCHARTGRRRCRTCWPGEATIDAPGRAVVLDRLLDVLLISALRARVREPRGRGAGLVSRPDRPGGRRRPRSSARGARPRPDGRRAGRTRRRQPGRSRPSLHRPARAAAHRLPHPAPAPGSRPTCSPESDATLPSIARRVGYGSPFALSAAFKREFGRSPQEYRNGGSPQSELATRVGGS
ncbi:helix-turn-helix domain-containing protein [Nocardioides sp. B-3]|uniref:helix-turn-helix domain-containing protein n=1 Tax=Nocardioides sp. B-3 TaxID=2895565 RepID=UPI003FA53DB8